MAYERRMPYLIHDPISVERLVSEVASPECGGTCVFVGTVRGDADAGAVAAIEYSAYEPMAEVELERICAEVRERWPQARIALRHRLGTVPVGEASIGIAAAAPHRAAAFESCRYVIEAVKQRVPIWKKERQVDGSAIWVDPRGRPAPADQR